MGSQMIVCVAFHARLKGASPESCAYENVRGLPFGLRVFGVRRFIPLHSIAFAVVVEIRMCRCPGVCFFV